jgi:hypothetical protein
MWFRAVFEISTRRTGISAMDLMRIMGFGSYKTAWTWLHKLRAALVRPKESAPLGPCMGLSNQWLLGSLATRFGSIMCSCLSSGIDSGGSPLSSAHRKMDP